MIPETEFPEEKTLETELPAEESAETPEEEPAAESRNTILRRIADASGAEGKKPAKKSSRRGMYTAAISAVVIVLVIVFNLIVGQLPSNLTELDITGYRLYNVSSVSKSFLREFEGRHRDRHHCPGRAVDERITKFISNYAAQSPHIKVTEVDPVTHPSALETYDTEDNHVVVINRTTGKQTSVQIQGFEGADSAMILYDYQSYYYSGTLTATRLDADGQLTSAINIVTGSNAGKLYTLTNHSEKALSAAIGERLQKLNLEQEELDLLLAGSIPSDCDVLVINNPQSDMTEEELT